MNRSIAWVHFLAWLGLAMIAGEVCGQESTLPPLDPAAPAVPAKENGELRQLSDFVTQLVLDQLPAEYENKKHWGQTSRVLDGWHIRRDGLEIKTKRRWKEVNDGTWKMYRLTMLDPDQEFRVDVLDIRPSLAGGAGLETACQARMRAFGRISIWESGIQLISVNVDATVTVRLETQCELAFELDTSHFPPDVVLKPKVASAELSLLEFKVHRISQLRGRMARELGTAIREYVEDELAENRSKLVEKINRQIAKKQDRLRVSLSEVLSDKWPALARTYLGIENAKPASTQ